MNRKNFRRALKHLTGELEPEQERELTRELADDPATAQRYERIKGIGEALEGSAYTAFGPGFSHRVMASLEGRPQEGGAFLIDLLAPLFVRFAPIALAVVVLLGIYNLTRADGSCSFIDEAFGLETVTAEALYDSLDAMAVFEE